MDKQQALLAEARGYICNALAAYIEAFGLEDEFPICEEMFEDVTDALRALETTIPMFKTLWEINKKVDPDQSFAEFLKEAFEKHGG